jgi:hypothetical protein
MHVGAGLLDRRRMSGRDRGCGAGLLSQPALLPGTAPLRRGFRQRAVPAGDQPPARCQGLGLLVPRAGPLRAGPGPLPGRQRQVTVVLTVGVGSLVGRGGSVVIGLGGYLRDLGQQALDACPLLRPAVFATGLGQLLVRGGAMLGGPGALAGGQLTEVPRDGALRARLGLLPSRT